MVWRIDRLGRSLSLLFGLLSSTALNMFVVPALYLRFGSHRLVLPAQKDVLVPALYNAKPTQEA